MAGKRALITVAGTLFNLILLYFTSAWAATPDAPAGFQPAQPAIRAAWSGHPATVAPGSLRRSAASSIFAPHTAGPGLASLTLAHNAFDEPGRTGNAVTASVNPVPLVNLPLVPSVRAPAGGDFTLTVNGTGFTAQSVVKWGESPLATTFVSASQLKAAVPASLTALPGSSPVTVVNPSPGGGTSNPAIFQITDGVMNPSFSKRSAPVGVKPQAVIAADFNNDGRLDLAVANSTDNNVSILLSQGGGSFQPQASFSTGQHPVSLAAGDFNRDGKADLAVANGYCPSPAGVCVQSGISILLGNGDGTFQPQTGLSTGFSPVAVAVGDFNADGNLDLAVTDFASSGSFGASVTMYLGNGDGTFKPGVDYPAVGQNIELAVSLGIGDFNGDGKLDIAAAEGYAFNEVVILLGNGDGTFKSAVWYQTGAAPYAVATGDLNGDGLLDLVTANDGGNSVSVLLGNGDGTFRPEVDYPAGVRPGSITLGDFDGDGKIDLAVANLTSDTVSILPGNGDGTFGSLQDFPVGSMPGSVVSADFDGDGLLDLAVANYGSNNLSILTQAPASIVGLSPASLSFGPQAVGTASAPQTLTMNNLASVPLTVSAITVEGQNHAEFTMETNCLGSHAAGENCTTTVVFSPQGVGVRSAFLYITDNGADSPQTVALSGTGVDFVFSALPPSATVLPGGSASFVLRLSPQYGFSGTVTLACSGAPAQGACSVNPSSMVLEGDASATLTVSTGARSTLLPAPRGPAFPPVSVWVTVMGGLFSLAWLARLFAGRRAKTPLSTLLEPWSGARRGRLAFRAGALAAVLISVTLWASCGGTAAAPHVPSGGTPSGVYTIIVTATSGSVTHSAPVTLTVM